MVELGSGSAREIEDIMLNRFDCSHDMSSERRISDEHVTNNGAVRETLLSRGITPEELPPSEDVKKVARRLTKTGKKALKSRDSLES